MVPFGAHTASPPPNSDDFTVKLSLERLVIASFALILSGIFLWMVGEFLPMLFLGAVLAMMLQPLNAWCARRVGLREGSSAILLVLASSLAVILPASLVVMILIDQMGQFANAVVPFIRNQAALLQEGGTRATILGPLQEVLPPEIQEELLQYQVRLMRPVREALTMCATHRVPHVSLCSPP